MDDATEAEHGERMIEVKVRFWTNNIAGKSGAIVPKHAWSSGVCRIKPNTSHGVRAAEVKPVHFHSLLDVGAAIEKVLIKHGIILHPSDRMRKYVRDKA